MRPKAALLLAALSACTPVMRRASLNPAPAAAGMVQLTVAEAALPVRLLVADRSHSDPDTRIALLIVARNAGQAPTVFHPDRLRLTARGHQTATVVGTPLQVVSDPSSAQRVAAGFLPPIPLSPGEARESWIVFGGLGGLPTRTSVELRLSSPQIEGDLLLASPTLPAPRWSSSSTIRRFNLGLGMGWSRTPTFSRSNGFDEEFTFSWGRFVAGAALMFGDLRRDEEGVRNDYSEAGLGLRVGWLPEQFPLGVMAGVDVRSLRREKNAGDLDAPDRRAGPHSVFASLRWNAVRLPRFGTSLVPIDLSGVSPVGLFTIDLGLVRWFDAGEFPGSFGPLLRFGFSLPRF